MKKMMFYARFLALGTVLVGTMIAAFVDADAAMIGFATMLSMGIVEWYLTMREFVEES